MTLRCFPDFRDQLIAAPLKRDPADGSEHHYRHFRDQLIAAPLKHEIRALG